MRKISLFSLVFTFLYIGITGFFFPLQGDDFMYSVALAEHSVWEIIVHAYCTWTLRLGEIVELFLLPYGKSFFNFLNPFIQLFLAFSLFLFLFRRKPDWRNPADLAGTALLFVFSTVLTGRPRDTVYWMTGSCVYALGLGIWFCFWGMLFARAGSEKKRSLGAAFFLSLLGFFAAAALENATLCGCLAGAFLAGKFFRDRKMPPCAVSLPLAACALGSAVFLLSPGRWVRLHTVGTSAAGFGQKMALLPELLLFWGGAAWLPLLLLGTALLLLYRNDPARFRKEIPALLFLLILSLLSPVLFLAAGITPALRAYLLSSLLIAGAALRGLFPLLASSPGKYPLAAKGVVVILLLAAFLVQLTAFPDFRQIRRDQEKREALLAESAGKAAVVPEHSVVRRHFLQYIWIEDFTDDFRQAANRNAAKYYSLPALRVAKKEVVPLYWKKR